MREASTSGLLEAALAEEGRLGVQYERAIGTSAEMATYLRLQAASRYVTTCHCELEDRGFSFSVAGGPEAPGEARNLVADGLAGLLDAAELDTLRLLVSEVTTNCVVHAGAGAAAQIDIVISLPPGIVRVEVSTQAAPFEHNGDAPATPAVDAAGGRGLYIVGALSRRWGIEPSTPNKVWFELATAAS